MTGLMLVELNEINFDLVRRYCEEGADLPVLTQLMRHGKSKSLREEVYEHLEPWIQ